MNINNSIYAVVFFLCCGSLPGHAEVALPVADQKSTVQESGSPANGLAPEIVDLTAEDISFAKEKDIADLATPFIDFSPQDQGDGIGVSELGENGAERKLVLAFANKIAAGEHGEVDSFLVYHDQKLVVESYFRRGRINYPHYQMSITKSYTAMAIGRAIQMGHLTLADLDKPVVSFLKDLDRDKLVDGAETITLAEAMNMRSGVRMSKEKINELRRDAVRLKGQSQIQAYLQHSQPITEAGKTFKYQSSDPAMAMQVLEAVVPGSARDFIANELLAKLGIKKFGWQDDVSGLPKAAAGSSMRSRDMVKWGMLVQNRGEWGGEQLVPKQYVERAVGKLHTNRQETSYGYFWWRNDMTVGEKTIDCKSGRGAGGQFIMMFDELDLILVFTSHNKGMGKLLKSVPVEILPAFVR